MSTVRLEIAPWLSAKIQKNAEGMVHLEMEIPHGSTVRHLLEKMAAKYGDFVDTVMDAQSGALTGQVSLVLNDSLIELRQGLDTELREGDTLALLPPFSGGQALGEGSLLAT